MGFMRWFMCTRNLETDVMVFKSYKIGKSGAQVLRNCAGAGLPKLFVNLTPRYHNSVIIKKKIFFIERNDLINMV